MYKLRGKVTSGLKRKGWAIQNGRACVGGGAWVFQCDQPLVNEAQGTQCEMSVIDRINHRTGLLKSVAVDRDPSRQREQQRDNRNSSSDLEEAVAQLEQAAKDLEQNIHFFLDKEQRLVTIEVVEYGKRRILRKMDAAETLRLAEKMLKGNQLFLDQKV